MTGKRVAVIGAGPMGLAAAYELAKKGWQVEIFERDDRIGGMSAHFDFDGLSLERFYHFVCAPDSTLFEYLDEFDLSGKLKWRDTKMGFFYDGKLYKWGNPLYLLTFPKLGLISKFRYALHVFFAKGIEDWRPYDRMHATEWLKKWVGKKAYDVLWRSLFDLKLHEYRDDVTAAWLGTRIKRVALSRKNIFQERMGYLEGGSEALLEAIRARLDQHGAQIHLSAGVEKILIEDGRVRGVRVDSQDREFDKVVSTIPLPYLVRLAEGVPRLEMEKIADIRNIGVVCVTFKLDQPFSDYFWMNINDSEIAIPGLIEYSNLNPLEKAVVYAPYYMPKTHEKYRKPDDYFVKEVIGYMKRVRPDFSTDWILSTNVARYEFAQTVCDANFYEKLPPMKSRVEGLFMADTSHYYPEDRSISESMRIGRDLARLTSA